MSPLQPNSLREFAFETLRPAWTQPEGEPTKQKNRDLPPIVTIFGAGIAGLSAAHELIERGFAVQVVEPTRSPDEENAVEVGGLASNQFGRVPVDPYLLHPHGHLEQTDMIDKVTKALKLRSRGMQPLQRRFMVSERILFDRKGCVGQKLDLALADDWGVRNGIKLRAVWETLKEAYLTYLEMLALSPESRDNLQTLDPDWQCREILFVEIRGHTNDDCAEAQNREVSQEWADQVCAYLEKLNAAENVIPADEFRWHFKPVGLGSTEPLGDQREPVWRARSNRVEFRIVEQLVPGEHGYRFFPAFYRHVFDTMRRTPILDSAKHATGETTFDRLVPTQDLGLAVGDGRPPATIQTTRVRSLEELRRLSELFLGRLGVTHRDIVRFQTRLLKFLTSSSERRCNEYEQESWWHFIGGDAERGYSPRMQTYLMETSQALVAMNAKETDARSQGNIVAQLQLQYLQDHTDFTLNGPTSDVWLRVWKRYLRRQGVRFFIGELGQLAWNDPDGKAPELVPITTHRSGWLAPPSTRLSAERKMQFEGLIARRAQTKLRLVVLDNEPGDYTVRIRERAYSFVARGEDRATIARALAKQIDLDPAVSAEAEGPQIVIEEKSVVRLPGRGVDSRFDASPVAGSWKDEDQYVLPAEVLVTSTAEFKQKLELLFQETSDDKMPRVTPSEWVLAGMLRHTDPDFDKHLSKLERKRPRHRELVPSIHIDSSTEEMVLEPPPWVTAVKNNVSPKLDLLYPYYFRTRRPSDDIDVDPSIWVQVQNADDNLKVVDKPIPEDPAHPYLSYEEPVPALQPDFYVLAVPLEQASTLLWRAEKDRRGLLDGCLAELLEFDRRTSRRTLAGEEIRLIRDPHGHPPPEHPFRDFAGVQYYFPNQVRVGKGHVYFPRAEWGLSSISQLAYWRERVAPTGPFMGQLSVDIGDFYNPAPPRHGGRHRRSAWNSSSREIAEEVWFQVRQGHERDRAGVLTAPNFFHLDDGIRFGDPQGGTFREEVSIVVKPDSRGGSYTVWVNEEPFMAAGGGTSREIAIRLRDAIRKASFGSLSVEVQPRKSVVQRGNQIGYHQLIIRSTLLHGAALVLVNRTDTGAYELRIGDHVYRYVATQPNVGRRAIRDGLYQELLYRPHPSVTARPEEETGLFLHPKGTADLPPVTACHEGQQLNVIFGPTLHVRLEQANDGLAFGDLASATIGRNRTPFLINVPGQWRYRPGLFRPDELTFEETVLRPGDDERVRYRISNRRWVGVGTHMATTTHLTTMESANESARHAVNAILRCLAFRPGGDDYNAQGRVFAELAEIWDPEKNELDDLEPLKRLDRKLAEEGLPHVMDILKIIDSVDAIPMHGKSSHDPVNSVLHLLQHVADGSDRDWAFARQTLSDLLGQAVARAHDGMDPIGVLKELQRGPMQIGERLREFLQTVLKASSDRPGASGGKGGADA